MFVGGYDLLNVCIRQPHTEHGKPVTPVFHQKIYIHES
jgi:hypothetical protein